MMMYWRDKGKSLHRIIHWRDNGEVKIQNIVLA